jgi:tetratricopeptide (TPR) repeat protein
MTAPDQLLQKAVAAYKSGQREEARALLLKYVEAEQSNELAWLLLSNLVPDTEDRIIALENALTLNPHNSKAVNLLWRLKQKQRQNPARRTRENTRRMKQAIEARKNGQGMLAFNILRQLVRDEPKNERAWWLLAQIAPETDTEIKALRRVVKLNPARKESRRRLNALLRLRDDPLALGSLYEKWGEIEKARSLYVNIVAHASSAAERHDAKRRLRNIEIHAQMPNLRLSPPWLTLLRLTAGPVLLYGLLALFQNGLNLRDIHLLLWLGGLSVTLGSFLLVLSTERDTLIIWHKLWKRSGRTTPAPISGLKPLGLLLWGIPSIAVTLGNLIKFLNSDLFW